jgi:uncharacterized protein (TIGR03905 family)
MSKHSYRPNGVCASQIDFELDGDVVHNVRFTGGCNGNLKAISAVVDGMTVEQIEGYFHGITCGYKDTSCSAQLAKAVRAGLTEEQERR